MRLKTGDIPVDGPGADVDFCVRFSKICTFLITKVFRCSLRKSMFEHMDFEKPGVLVVNHSNGLWGIIDIFTTCYFWYAVAGQRKPLAFMSDARVFQVPVIGYYARRLGFKISSIAALKSCLEAGNWAIVPPGGNTDQLRSIWHRNQTRMYKLQYRDGKFVKKPQTWFVYAAAQLGVTAYPVSVAGAHEVTPILWESKTIFRLSGLVRLRREEFWPGFPVTLNHFINLAIFYFSGWMHSPIAWAIFLFVNIYIDLVYSYPVMIPRLRVRFGESMELKYTSDKLTVKESQKENLSMLRRLNEISNRSLVELDKGRTVFGRLPSHKPEVGF